MSEIIEISVPFTVSAAAALRAGDRVSISGVIYTARDAAHLRLCQRLEAGEELPLDLTDQIIYYVGPTPAPEGRAVGSAGPTTSGRMDRFAPLLYEQGLRGTIGKGYRDRSVAAALEHFAAVHFTALGGAGALLSRCITACEIVAYEDLGAEAIRRLTVTEFPATVAYDAHGRSVYE